MNVTEERLALDFGKNSVAIDGETPVPIQNELLFVLLVILIKSARRLSAAEVQRALRHRGYDIKLAYVYASISKLKNGILRALGIQDWLTNEGGYALQPPFETSDETSDVTSSESDESAATAAELEFPVEVADQYGKYTGEQKWKVVFRTAGLMYGRGEEISQSSLAKKAGPYLPKLQVASVGAYISGLENPERLELHLPPKQLRESSGGWEPPADEGTTVPDFGANGAGESEDPNPPAGNDNGPIPEAAPVAEPSAEKKPPFSMFASLGRELAELRAKLKEAPTTAPHQPAIDIGGGVGLDTIYRRDS